MGDRGMFVLRDSIMLRHLNIHGARKFLDRCRDIDEMRLASDSPLGPAILKPAGQADRARTPAHPPRSQFAEPWQC